MPTILSSTVNVSLYSINCSLVDHGFWRAAQILFFVILEVLVVAIPLAVVLGAAAGGSSCSCGACAG